MSIVSKPGVVKVIIFNDSEYTAICNACKSDRKNPAIEKMQTVKKAASIIRNANYDSILENIDLEIAKKLKFLLDEIILHKKRYNLKSYERKITTICHAILRAVKMLLA